VQLNAVYKCKTPSRTDKHQALTRARDAFRHRLIHVRCVLDKLMGGHARHLALVSSESIILVATHTSVNGITDRYTFRLQPELQLFCLSVSAVPLRV
jgi:hypothetical protein